MVPLRTAKTSRCCSLGLAWVTRWLFFGKSAPSASMSLSILLRSSTGIARTWGRCAKASPLDDPRVHVHNMSLDKYLRALRYKSLPDVKIEGDGYLAVILDLDEGPSQLLRPKNADLYSEDGLQDLEEALRPVADSCGRHSGKPI